MNILHRYENGNTLVTLFEDGTKEREYEGVPLPHHPESMDVKITDWCNAGCKFCHEDSTTKGKHGDLNHLLQVLSTLPSGVELAIGGGAPQRHPDLIPFLEELKRRGIVANITINQVHLKQDYALMSRLVKDKLVTGIGISYSNPKYIQDVHSYMKLSPNVVVHLIMGINTLKDIDDLCKLQQDVKVLVLGYKQWGRGNQYLEKNPHVEENKYRWYVGIRPYLSREGLIISFDNLALTQLKLNRFFSKETWDKYFMGDDFTFTMYVDAVKKEYSPSSTSSNRIKFDQMSLLDYFKEYRNESNRDVAN